MPNFAQIRDGIDLSGRTDAKQVYVRAEDATLLTLPNVSLYLDPVAKSFTTAGRGGRSIANAGKGAFAFTSSNVTRSVSDPLWGRDLLISANSDCDVAFQAGFVTQSYTILIAASYDASNYANGSNHYLFSSYDPIASQSGPRANFFASSDGSSKGISFNPNPALSNNGVNAPAAAIPAALTRSLIAFSFNAATLTSKIYVGDPATPVVTRTDHVGAMPLISTLQWRPFGVFGQAALGIVGKLAKFIVIDETTVKVSDVQRAAIFAELKTNLGIA